jgi:hypothetical protein
VTPTGAAGSGFRIRSIGIAMAVYRPDPAHFREQLHSIQDQTWRDWICVMTADSPLAEIRGAPGMEPFLRDERFVWIENASRRGAIKNFEDATAEVLKRGVDAIAFADQDDIWLPEKLALQRERLLESGPLSLVHCDAKVLYDADGSVDSRSLWEYMDRDVRFRALHNLFVQNLGSGNCVLMDADLARRFPRLPPDEVFHDHWYNAVASVHGGLHAMPERLVLYRQHGANVSGVSHYRGLFWSEAGDLKGRLERVRIFWRRANLFARFADAEGLPLKAWHRAVFIRRWDLGLGLLLLGLWYLPKNRPLGRGYLIRAAGKLVSTFD